MAAIYCKGKPSTPAIVGGVTFTLFDEARGIWSGTATAPQETALCPAGSIFMLQTEYDRFKADFDALATYDTAIAAKTGPAKGKFNELATMLPLYYQARGWDADGRPTAETRERLSL